MRLAPMRQSASSIARRASCVIASLLPGPIPTIFTLCANRKPKRHSKLSNTCEKDFPSRCFGRPITSTFAPAFRAAATLAAKPPASPPSFVTSHLADTARSIASSISSENGPCIAKMCDGCTPASRQSASDASSGSTRA